MQGRKQLILHSYQQVVWWPSSRQDTQKGVPGGHGLTRLTRECSKDDMFTYAGITCTAAIYIALSRLLPQAASNALRQAEC